MKKDWMNLFGSKEGKVTQKETDAEKEFFTVDNLKEHLRLLVAIDQPIGMYITDKEGVILAHNEHYCKLLGLETIVDGETNCSDFYQNPQDRIDRNNDIDKDPEKDKWFVDVILLKNHKDEVIVKDSTHKVFDDNGEHIAYFGYLVDVKYEYRFGRLFENLLIGSYQLDKEDRFVKINKAAETMLGYTSEELEGKHVKTVYAEEDKYHELKEGVQKAPHYVKNAEVQLVTKDGKLIWTSVDAYKIPLTGDKYFGRHGTIIDVTDSFYQRKLADFPVGYYVVLSNGKTHTVEHCNDKFAEIFGYGSSDEVKGKKPKDFFENDNEYNSYLEELEKANKGGKSLVAHRFRAKKKDGSTFDAEISSQYNKDIDQKIIGRVGVVRDISQEIALTNRITEISGDIGAVLHTYSTLLLLISAKLEAIKMYMGNDPFEDFGELSGIIVNREIHKVFKPIAKLIKTLVEEPSTHKYLQDADDEETMIFIKLMTMFVNNYEVENPRQMIPSLREITYALMNFATSVIKKDIGYLVDIRPKFEELKDYCHEALRILSLVALHEITDDVIVIEPNLNTFRVYVTQDVRANEESRVIHISELLRDLISDFKEYAHHSRTEFRATIPDTAEVKGLGVKAIKKDLERALHNILHNAIKYSWNRGGVDRFVEVVLKRIDEWAVVIVQNYGVAIMKEEIENKLIFTSGYRGLNSDDRKRLGTGFGLSDSYNVIVNKLQGKLEVSSVPARYDINLTDYSKPFITTVTIMLHISAQQDNNKKK